MEEKNKYFKEIINLLSIVKDKVNSTADVNWTTYDSAEELIDEINYCIKSIEAYDLKGLEKVKIHFLPTSTFQELAISNGWGDEYISLADKFYVLHEKITS